MPVYSQSMCDETKVNWCANLIWYLSRRLMKQPCCGERFAKMCSNRQHPPSKQERSTVGFSNDVPTTRKRSIFNLNCTYRAGRGSKLNTFYCYEDEEESVLVLSVIRACLDGVLVVNLDWTTWREIGQGHINACSLHIQRLKLYCSCAQNII